MEPEWHYPAFEPLLPSSHLTTIAGNFWPRRLDLNRFPAIKRTYAVSPGVTVVALENQPPVSSAQIVLLHGLEGSAHAGYLQSMTQAALERGFGVHRLNLRSCGGTEDLCETMYHSGLTSDTWHVLRSLHQRFQQPIFLIGCSLGGNVALKLAGEYSIGCTVAGVCAVSAPIDLAASVRVLDRPQNRIYAQRFLHRLKARIRRKSATTPSLYSADALNSIHSIWEFDDRFTAPLFGFGTAANYYRTQSAQNYLPAISVPSLLIAAQDDPIVPFSAYRQPAVVQNSFVRLISPLHGGHLGFLSRHRPRFWLDVVIMRWVAAVLAQRTMGTAAILSTSP